MKQKLKNEISNLINGSELKQKILVVSFREPGVYEFRDNIYNESEFEILKMKYAQVAIFVPATKKKNQDA